jgi:tight adherence protein C
MAITLAFLGLVLLGAIYPLTLWLSRRARTQERLFGAEDPESSRVEEAPPNFLSHWLFLAGYRRRDASLIFIAGSMTLFALGGLVAFGVSRSRLIANLVEGAAAIPGGVGDLALPFLYGLPWIIVAFATLVPAVIVRAARRRRVNAVEGELSVVLEMLATLAEAGLGFDAAIARLIDVHPDSTPLVDEMKLYQTELLGGVSRTQGLRRIKARLDITSVTVFVSALVQAEQAGAALTDVLRRQAEDARNRARQRALIKAEGLPTKLVFPLVICYLPGLFVTTLGPSMLQFIKLADTFSHKGRPTR